VGLAIGPDALRTRLEVEDVFNNSCHYRTYIRYTVRVGWYGLV
jgi:hypothetical protein